MSDVRLFYGATYEEITPRILRPPTRAELEAAQRSWASYKSDHAPDELPDFHEWDWLKKKGAAYASALIAIEYGGELQGLLCLADNFVVSRHNPAVKVMYIEYLEAAIWKLLRGIRSFMLVTRFILWVPVPH